jgi:hypothetical protein
MKAVAVLALVIHATSVLAACPPEPAAGKLLDHPSVQVAWRSEPSTITVGQPFVLHITLCPSTATLSRVDASMPAHRHGMNYKPSIKNMGPGLWRVEGLLWHMPGLWELRLDAQHDGSTHTLRHNVSLP